MPTLAEQRLALDRVHTRTTQCFTLFIWISKVRPHLRASDPNGAEILSMMSNASIETTLMSFRSLNEFFRKREGRRRVDDVVAEDCYEFVSSGPFLTEVESRELNKRVMHLPYQDTALDEMGWKIAEWTARGVPRVSGPPVSRAIRCSRRQG